MTLSTMDSVLQQAALGQKDLKFYKVRFANLKGNLTFGCDKNEIDPDMPQHTTLSANFDFKLTLVADADQEQKFLDIVMTGVGVNPGNTTRLPQPPTTECSPSVQVLKEVVVKIEPERGELDELHELVVYPAPQPETVNQQKTVTESTKTSTGFSVEFSKDGGKAGVSYSVEKSKQVTMDIMDWNVVQLSTDNKPSWTFYATRVEDCAELSLYTFSPHVQCSFRAGKDFNQKVKLNLIVVPKVRWYSQKCRRKGGYKEVLWAPWYPLTDGALTLKETVEVDFGSVSCEP